MTSKELQLMDCTHHRVSALEVGVYCFLTLVTVGLIVVVAWVMDNLGGNRKQFFLKK